jgi:propionyl-CoA carboxylase alpha chain
VTAPGFRRLLVANRGEIARRVFRSASAAGLRTVAVYSETDSHAPFVREADTAVALRGRTATETYLCTEQLLAAARRSGADAVHPGYGFLSESGDFAEAVLDAGLAWIGPPPEVIRTMGDKLEAKRLMAAAGVPTLDVEPDDPTYPVIVKAAAGGGGKGMRIVERAEDLAEALAAARREAAAAFGDGEVFLEPYLAGARHVEIQVLADRHGNVVHCFERECSIQRRHQKIVEEAPSPALDATLRAAMGEAAVAAARAVGYESVGTVEFLLDSSGRYYFLEMNTRIQVEHPVTEAVTGLDLVREQLLIASGARLSVTQGELFVKGHAVEARLYAEDPSRDFLPQTGTLVAFEPSTDPPVRVDSGVETGSDVTTDFDPMLAKVIAHAPTREEAALRLALALERFRIAGVVTNRDYLVNVLRSAEFLAGDTTTDFVERVALDRRRIASPAEVAEAAIAAALHDAHLRHARNPVVPGIPLGWRNSVMPPERVGYEQADVGEVLVEYRALRDGTFEIRTNLTGDVARSGRVVASSEQGIDVEVDGRLLRARVTRAGRRVWCDAAGTSVELHELSRFPEGVEADEVAGGLAAPMPGKVTSVLASEGDVVTEGQLLVLVEAMKMEHRIVAPHAGLVAEIRARVDAQVESGDILVVIEPTPSEAADPAGTEAPRG